MRVCVHVSVCVRASAYVCDLCMCVSLHACVFVIVHVSACRCLRACVCECLYACVCVHVSAFMCLCASIWVRVSACVCVLCLLASACRVQCTEHFLQLNLNVCDIFYYCCMKNLIETICSVFSCVRRMYVL